MTTPWAFLGGLELMPDAPLIDTPILMTDLVDQWLAADAQRDDLRIRVAYSVTELSCKKPNGEVIGKCLRAITYDRQGVPESNPNDAWSQRRFDMGKLVETREFDYYYRMGVVAKRSVRFSFQVDGVLVNGEIDGAIWQFTINTEKYAEITTPRRMEGVELKSAYGRKFMMRINAAPDEAHVIQAFLYAMKFKTAFRLIYVAVDEPKYRAEYLIYYRKLDSGDFTPLVNGIPYEHITWNGIKARALELHGYVQRKELAPRDFKWNVTDEQTIADWISKGKISPTKLRKFRKGETVLADWQCLYCNHLDTCWPERKQKETYVAKETDDDGAPEVRVS